MTRIRTVSDRALLVETADLDEAMRMHAALEHEALGGVSELVPAARTILVRFDPSLVAPGALARRLREVAPACSLGVSGHDVVIPVRYDGADLAEVAAVLDCSIDAVIARHTAAVWHVAFTGFAPGFGYLAGNDPTIDVPRRSTPRTRIPAGSVALAGTFAGIYPRESPGGWQLIGTTDAVLWDLDRDPPALLTPGATVRFERSERSMVTAAPATAPRAADGELEVVRSGLQLLAQDRGRAGMAALGVSASGTADRQAAATANAAVGNPPDAAVLECAGGGAVFRVHAPLVAAVTGADGPISLHAEDGVREPALGVPFALESGDELRLGPVRRGLRRILAVRGGIGVDAVLGSRATDTLAGLGPAPLAAGDRIRVGDARTARAVVPEAAPGPVLPAPGETVTLDIVLGPRDDWLTDAGREALVGQSWLVTPRSDRVGIRLHGEVPLARADGELPSEGAVTGALQVPPDGQPVLFLPDHPLTGGYPIVAAVVDRHLDLAGQLPPGARIQFRVVQE